jgi:hypothetical protein
MKRVVGLMVVVVMGIPCLAPAEEDQEAVKAPPKWSLGAGIGFGGSSSAYCLGLGCLGGVPTLPPGGLGSIGGYGGSWTPQGRILLERQLSRSLALMIDGSASYTSSESSTSDLSNTSSNLGVGLGLRWLLNPDGAVEVSIAATLSGYWSTWDYWLMDLSSSKLDVYSYTVSAGVGLVLERKLLDNLYLRLESNLVRLGYSWFEYKNTWVDTRVVSSKSSSHSFNAGVALSPSIQLRLTF